MSSLLIIAESQGTSTALFKPTHIDISSDWRQVSWVQLPTGETSQPAALRVLDEIRRLRKQIEERSGRIDVLQALDEVRRTRP